jgi:hypothetical protein
MRNLTAVLVALSLGIGVASAARADEPRCGEYVEQLRRARIDLERGDRDGALGALRRAKAALRACGQEGSSEGGSGSHAHSDQAVLG